MLLLVEITGFGRLAYCKNVNNTKVPISNKWLLIGTFLCIICEMLYCFCLGNLF